MDNETLAAFYFDLACATRRAERNNTLVDWHWRNALEAYSLAIHAPNAFARERIAEDAYSLLMLIAHILPGTPLLPGVAHNG